MEVHVWHSHVALQERSFMPSPFAAAPGANTLTAPWFLDYAHLMFWFYFLTAGLLTWWLIQTFFWVVTQSESRGLSRETRGLSRAQAGDSITAVIPLSWSVTMLMHASSNSSNFDENTTGAAQALGVVAYQWGWAYYLPQPRRKAAIQKQEITTQADYSSLLSKPEPRVDYEPKPTSTPDFTPNWLPSRESRMHETFWVKIPIAGLDFSAPTSKELLEFSTTRLSGPMHAELMPVRLRVNRGLILPQDTAIHVTCGSKDVIHSWAIPALGIKIDCIPGYNCHRRLYLRWRGLFWGQCMEVCGRYHHWMPILIRVAPRSEFELWCASAAAQLSRGE